jgi:HAE1 family hydrophobic/amphiphilic exporter-1
MFGLIFFGALSFQEMGINENPDVDYPSITIRYSYPGATPAVIEKDVLEPAESVLVSMEGIRDLTSSAERGSARISLEFDLNRDIDFALQEVTTLLNRAQRDLPDTLEPPTVTKSNAADDPIMYLSLQTNNLNTRELNLLFRDRVSDRLSTVDGVAEIRAFGYHEPQLRIDLDAKKLKKYQLTANDIVDSIQREHQELPAGRFEYDDREDQIRIMGEVSQVDEFKNLIISRRGGSPNFQPQRIKDVATIYEGVENIRRANRINGVPALGMAVQKQRGINSVAVAERVRGRIADVNAELPEGTKLSINFDTTQFVKESVSELIFTIILSALLTSLVCWLFIGSVSASVNILLAIPTAIIGTFIFINLFGFTLNTFTLLALALAIGVVVDDAIVMLENIIRFLQKGYDRVNAAFKGAREITFAVIATSIALISIFFPITLIPGIEGRFFFEFAVTISVALALSSLEALTLAPMRCSQFLKIGERSTLLGRSFDRLMEKIKASYERLLSISLKHRWKTIFVSAFVFALSLGSFKFLSLEFVPDQDRGVLFVIFIAPEGKSMNYTSKKVAEAEKIFQDHPAVDRVISSIGGFGQGGESNRANTVIVLKSPDSRDKNQFQVASDLRNQLKSIEGIRYFIRDRSGNAIAGRRGSPIEFTISGPDPAQQIAYYQEFKKFMDQDPAIVGTRSDDADRLPEIHIIPDRKKAQSRGIEIQEIAETINTTLGGVAAVQYTDGGRRFDAFVQLEEKDRQKAEDLKPILIRNNRGELVPLVDVVEFVETEGPSEIYRENRVRGIRVDANLVEGAKSGDAIARIQEWAAKNLDPKYFIRFSDTPQDKLFEILLIMLLGIVFAYMVLASQFNSFVDPLLVFLALPFGITGALLALWIGGQTLNVYSIIGILLTMGIVKKNSILIVEFTNQLRDRGYGLREALIEASRTRLRPILMTNSATLAAAIPPALALGPGAETRVPMALTVIGGILMAVAFTIFIVPCAYSLIAPKRINILEEDDDKNSELSA